MKIRNCVLLRPGINCSNLYSRLPNSNMATRGGRNVDDQNVNRPKISERRNGLFSWSECQKSKRSERRKCLLSWSLLRHHNVENGFWVDHYIEKNEKNIKNLNFVWFLHFNYLWRHFNYLWHMVLWTTGIKKWIFKNSLTWLKLT